MSDVVATHPADTPSIPHCGQHLTRWSNGVVLANRVPDAPGLGAVFFGHGFACSPSSRRSRPKASKRAVSLAQQSGSVSPNPTDAHLTAIPTTM